MFGKVNTQKNLLQHLNVQAKVNSSYIKIRWYLLLWYSGTKLNDIRNHKIFVNKKWTKNSSSGKCSLKVQCLIENLFRDETQRKVIVDKIFWYIQDKGQRYIFYKSILSFCSSHHTVDDYPYSSIGTWGDQAKNH